MSLHILKLFGRSLPLAVAALFVHIGGATAADSAGDIQQQTQELLTGVRTTHSIPAKELHDGKRTSPMVVDTQEFVKRFLLGTTLAHTDGSETIQPVKPPAASSANMHTDFQSTVRQFLLGQHQTPNAS